MNRKGRRQAAKTIEVRSGASEAERISALHAAVSAHLREGRWLDAQLCCEQALALDAENPKTLHLAGLACFNSGQYGQAIEWISRAIRRQPESLYLADLGAALAKQGRIDEAVQAVDEAAPREHFARRRPEG
jgi:tetratricopeptide (TPR) repeat protein